MHAQNTDSIFDVFSVCGRINAHILSSWVQWPGCVAINLLSAENLLGGDQEQPVRQA